MKLLIDTNVYLDLLLKREGHETCRELFYICAKKRNQTFVTSMSLRDIEYVLHKYIHNSQISRKMQHWVYEITTKVISISSDAAIGALFEETNDYEDNLQMLAAQEAMLDAIITKDKKHFKECKIPVFTPEEICKLLKQ